MKNNTNENVYDFYRLKKLAPGDPDLNPAGIIYLQSCLQESSVNSTIKDVIEAELKNISS